MTCETCADTEKFIEDTAKALAAFIHSQSDKTGFSQTSVALALFDLIASDFAKLDSGAAIDLLVSTCFIIENTPDKQATAVRIRQRAEAMLHEKSELLQTPAEGHA